MSGGVDSSVAAFLMKEKGYECIGATMKLFQNEDVVVCREHTCCSLDDVEDARSVARALEMPYYVFNFSDRFKEEVMEKFVCSYENGCTPNPCIDCNRYLKFEKLFQRAKELSYDYVVTGHYAQIEYNEETGRYLLKKSVDLSKDQSYVLYSLTQDQLAHVQFPLGGMHKTEAREIAEAQGFINARKHDSQDICFVPDGDYAGFIEREIGDSVAKEGNFVLEDGTVLGKHKGITHYTIGQRKGLNLSMGKPVFVTEIRPETNEVVIGDNEDLFVREVYADRINFMSVPDLKEKQHFKAKIRYAHQGAPALIEQIDDDLIRCTFEEPQRAMTPGQALVFYDGEYVAGGGTIIKR